MLAPETQRLVEQSAVPLLNKAVQDLRELLDRLEGQHLKLEHKVLGLEAEFQSSLKATKALAEEVNKAFQVRTHITSYVNKGGKQTYYRDPSSVLKRWTEWKKLLDEGVPISAVAARWGINRRTIHYARKHNFKPTNRIKNQQKGYDESNYRPSSDNRTDRLVWRSYQQKKQRRKSQRIRIAHT